MSMRLMVLCAASLFLTSCLSQLKTREDLKGQTPASQKQPVVQQSAQPAAQESNDSTPAYQQEERNSQMRTLHGRVEEAEQQVQELRQSMIELAQSRQKEKDEAAAKLQAYEDAIKNMEAQIEAMKVAQATPAPAPAPEEPAKPGAKPKNEYQKGEDLFKEKKWKDAIVAYQKYRDENPKSKLYPDATYKMGLSFLELGLKDESKAFFEEVRLKFPKSPLAKKAEKQLKSL